MPHREAIRSIIDSVTEGRPPAILLLDDESEVRALVAAMLKKRDAPCDAAGSLAEARALMGVRRYDILLVDVNLPDGSGLSICGQPPGEGPVTIVMTGNDDIDTAVAALRAGAADYITKPFTLGEFLSRFDRALEECRTREKIRRYARALETLARIKSEELLRSSRQVEEVRAMTVASLGAALNLKDHETADHCARVSENSVRLGRLAGLSEVELQDLRWGATLHDVGKIGVPEAILLKTGALTPEERFIMERHPVLGMAVLGKIEFLGRATDVVLSHHERYDGKGYPRGLRAGEIPVNARIFSLLDTLDAMTSRRPYRDAAPVFVARAELERQAGTQFDPDIVAMFLRAPSSAWAVQPPGTPARSPR
jgi:putative nucleotidyltransferase with HDIG domain